MCFNTIITPPDFFFFFFFNKVKEKSFYRATDCGWNDSAHNGLCAQLPSLTGNFARGRQLLASHHLLLARPFPNKVPPAERKKRALTSNTLNYGIIIQEGGLPCFSPNWGSFLCMRLALRWSDSTVGNQGLLPGLSLSYNCLILLDFLSWNRFSPSSPCTTCFGLSWEKSSQTHLTFHCVWL